jgi:hypothetical protein
MIGFLIAIALGFATPFIEAPLAQPLARIMERKIRLETGEVKVLAFAMIAILAGLIAVLFGSSNAFWIGIGVTLGYFGTRIISAVRELIEDSRR